MKIKRADGTIVDRKGQLTDADPAYTPVQAPTDIPSIVERYVNLVGKAVHKLDTETELKPADIRTIVSLGKGVAMLQVIEVNKLAQQGGRPVSQMTTEEIRGLLNGASEPAQEEIDAEIE